MSKLFKRFLILFFGINLVNFLLFYISTYVLRIDGVEYVRFFISEFIDFALWLVGAVLIAGALSRFGFKGLWLGLPISLGKFVYAYPYYYLFFIYEGRLLTDEALLLSIPAALLNVVFVFVLLALLAFIIYLVTDVLQRKRGGGYSECVIRNTEPFDFGNSFAVGSFFAGGVIFLFMLSLEISDTVKYLIDNRGTYRIEEIIYIVISFIMIALELISSQYIAMKVKNKEISNNANI